MNENNYGFSFNDIIIHNDKFIKKYKNEYGRIKINNEILFYKFITNNNIDFSIPKMLHFSEGEIVLQYITPFLI